MMDKRSFIFGLGIGIVFSVTIIWLVFNISGKDNNLSNDEIEEKARMLGMEYVSEKSTTQETTETQTEVTSNKPATYEAETAEIIDYKNVEEETVISTNNEVIENKGLEQDSFENVSDTTKAQDENGFISFKISSGSNARKVSKILQSSGVINDAKEYEKYLINNKKTTDLKTGTYKVPKSIDFEDLTNIITKKK